MGQMIMIVPNKASLLALASVLQGYSISPGSLTLPQSFLTWCLAGTELGLNHSMLEQTSAEGRQHQCSQCTVIHW